MYAANAGILPNSLQGLFLPGLFVSSMLRFGSDDIGTVFTTFVVDSILFGAVVLVLDVLFIRKKPTDGSLTDHG